MVGTGLDLSLRTFLNILNPPIIMPKQEKNKASKIVDFERSLWNNEFILLNQIL